MAFVDVAVIGILVAGLLVGWQRGFLTQATGVVGIVAGFYLADRFHEGLRVHVVDRVLDSDNNGAIAFVAIVVAVLIVTMLASWLVRKLVENFELGAYDRAMGGVFGGLKAALLCAALLLVLTSFAPSNGSISHAIGRSRAGPVLWHAIAGAARMLPGDYAARASAYLEEHRPGSPVREVGAVPTTNE